MQGSEVQLSARCFSLFARALGIFAALGDTWGTAQATARLGHAARARGDPALARARYEEARDLYRLIADGRSEARMLVSLGDLADEEGDASAAESLYRGALTLRHGLGDMVGTAAALEMNEDGRATEYMAAGWPRRLRVP